MVRLVVGELAAREVRRSAFGVWRLAFGVRRSAAQSAGGGRIDDVLRFI